ncbi:MAG: hypothetical protein JSS27_11005 [Planctomycetes bacterium]|nr:hypothetical protein [Planctomycetota bacterium]
MRASCWFLGVGVGIVAVAVALPAWADEPASNGDSPAADSALVDKPVEAPTLVGKALETTVRAALRKAAQAGATTDEALVRQMLDLYQRVQADQSLPKAQRDGLRLALRSRLQRAGQALRAAVPIKAGAPVNMQPAANVKAAGAIAPVFAQQLAPGAGGVGGLPNQQPATYGQDLADLIEETIQPASWDVQGGSGVIRFWAPGSALVVRQTGEVHGDVGQLLPRMR